VAGIERGEEWLFQLDRADAIVVAAANTHAVTIHRLAEFAQSLAAALLVQIQIGAYAIFRAIFAMLLDLIAGAALHSILISDGAPINRKTLILAHARASSREQRGQYNSQPGPTRRF
jgi:hypothetical protein